MGTWSDGNFDNDGARDLVGALVAERVAAIEAILAKDGAADADERGETELMPSVAIIYTLCDHCGGAPPEPQVIESWAERYLAAFDRSMPGLRPKGDFQAKRRAVIERTFRALRQMSAEFWRM